MEQPPSIASASTNNPVVEKGKLQPRKAISTATQAQKLGDRLVQDDEGRDRRRAEIQRAINGAAPYSERALAENNQSHRFNVSFGYLEGACGRAYAPYLDLGLDEEFVARIDAELDETKKDIVRSKFVAAVRRWGMWSSNYNGLVRETVDFGYCVAIFPDPTSPWWFPVRQREGLTFARARNVASKLDVFCWRRSYLIHELYDHVADKDAAEAAGWSVENVWQALENAAPNDYTKSQNMGGRQIYEEAIRAAAFAVSTGEGAKVIDVYHTFCRELSGKVSHWVVLDSAAGGRAPPENNDEAIQLFYQFEQFESMSEVVERFDFEYGDGYWHGAKGLAQKLYGVHKAHDRLMCSGLDQTFRGGLGVLKCNSQKGHESAILQVTNDFVYISPDAEAQPGVKMPTLAPEFFSMDAALLATAVQRGGDVAPEAMGIERSQKTATQSTIDQGQKQVITKANLKRWIPSLSSVIDKMLKRLLNVEWGADLAAVPGAMEAAEKPTGHPDSVRFVQDLLDAGLTREDLQSIKKAEVFHTVEDVFGETKQNISYIADKYRMDPDAARIDLKKREIGIWLGPQASLELIPGDADQLEAMKASRLQTLEISSILDGNSIPVAPDDLHPVHLQTGVNYINEASKKLVEGRTSEGRMPTPQDVTNIAAHLAQHVEAQGAVKGQRESSREMAAMLDKSIADFQAAMQINQQKHLAAVKQGMTTGVMEQVTSSASGAPPSAASPSASQPTSPQPSPQELMVA